MKLIVLWPYPMNSFYVDYPELKARKKDIIFIKNKSDLKQMEGLSDQEFINGDKAGNSPKEVSQKFQDMIKTYRHKEYKSNKCLRITHANEDQIKEIMQIFRKYKDIFPHVREDYIKRHIIDSRLIYYRGCVISYDIYQKKVKLGNVDIPKGACILHQIAIKEQGNDIASHVLSLFTQSVSTDIYLTVRTDNARAISFYKKNGFQKIGDITWKKGEIIGEIYVKRYPPEETDAYKVFGFAKETKP